MSRGGRRGGFGGGAGGRQSSTKIAGFDLPWEFDPSEDPNAMFKSHKPVADLYPPMRVYRPAPPSAYEIGIVEAYKAVRDTIHDSPYYSVLGDSLPAAESAGASSSSRPKRGDTDTQPPQVTDPFEGGLATFTHRYKKVRKRMPTLTGREYTLRFFPKELWPLLDSTASKTQDEDATGAASSKSKTANDDDDDDNEDDDNDDDYATEDQDDDFEADEDDPDDDNDYNAERYFDGGEDDLGDGGDEGGGGGAWMD